MIGAGVAGAGAISSQREASRGGEASQVRHGTNPSDWRTRPGTNPCALADLTPGSVPCRRVLSMARPRSKPISDYLLIDISNSFTKIAFSSRSRISRPARIPTDRLTRQKISALLREGKARRIVVCSVVPAKNAVIKKAAGATKILWLGPKINLGVKIDYPKPKLIGADRLANAVAVAKLYGYPAIVVDFGTAVTFDIISAAGAYIGGVIAPGLEAMTNFLYQRTALLPQLSLREPKRAVGKSTREAMISGAIYGYRGLVCEIIAQIKDEQFRRQKVKVVATGGYARLIAARVPAIGSIYPNLTLEGLRLVANLNR
jgi:type III pantothenate kinase